MTGSVGALTMPHGVSQCHAVTRRLRVRMMEYILTESTLQGGLTCFEVECSVPGTAVTRRSKHWRRAILTVAVSVGLLGTFYLFVGMMGLSGPPQSEIDENPEPIALALGLILVTVSAGLLWIRRGLRRREEAKSD